MKNSFFLILGLVVIIGSIFLFLKSPVKTSDQTTVIINGKAFVVELANTPEKRTKGLSGREGLPEGEGMLFVFDNPGNYGFWMKDMNFSIDILWIDENSKIVGIEESVAPETFPNIFYPNQAVKYVLELSAGASEKYRIDIGSVIQ